MICIPKLALELQDLSLPATVLPPRLDDISQLLTRYYCNLSCTEHVIIFLLYSTDYLVWPNKKNLPWFHPKNWQVKNIAHTHTIHNTTHKNKMSRCHPTPSGFALFLHGNICHGPKSWCCGSPQVYCRHLAVGVLLLRLIPLAWDAEQRCIKK